MNGSKNKKYPLNQSPFYKLSSKRKLAELLGCSGYSLLKLSKRKDNYRCFAIRKKNKLRQIEPPKARLKYIHKRIFNLLRRIETPKYLHSGVKKKSHVSNALSHQGNTELFKVDLKSFYPNTKEKAIYHYFHYYLFCSIDVAACLASLTTYDGHVPTGSPLSQLLAFYANKKMFDDLNILSIKHDTKMTCYVDDLTFSGDKVSGEFIWAVKKLIKKHGMEYHKEKIYKDNQPKLITGVILRGNEAFSRNEHQKDIHESLAKYSVEGLTESEGQRLLGRLYSAGQVENRFIWLANLVRREMNSVKK